MGHYTSIGGGFRSIMEIKGATSWPQGSRAESTASTRRSTESGTGGSTSVASGAAGDVTIWLSEDAIAAWIPPKNGLRGGQRRYSNLAIRTALTLRVVFGLPLRQTEAWRSAFCSRAHRGTSTWRSRREACNRSRVPRDALSPGSPPISRGSGGSARVCRIDASLSLMWCALCCPRCFYPPQPD